MGDTRILGEGSYAVVVGPIQPSTLRKLGIGFLTRPPYIIKIYKRPFEDASYQEVMDKQRFYTHLEKQSRHKSVLFPLATFILHGQDIRDVFPFLRPYLDRDRYYQVEVETYGGISLERVVFHKKKPIFSVRGFMRIWRCVPDILEDCYHILFDNNMIMTDIKMENMVLSPDKKLRLIDVDVNPNTATSRTITPYIRQMPPQYFSDEWWAPSFEKTKKRLMQAHKTDYQDIHKRENKMIVSILDFIHNYKDPYLLVSHQRLTKQENKSQRLFFVAYPLFLMILFMIVFQCVYIRSEPEKKRVRGIVYFCLDYLRKRGHFSSQMTFKDFQQFIWKMKSL